MSHLNLLKSELIQFKDGLCQEFSQHRNINLIMHKLTTKIDEILILLFNARGLYQPNKFCLLATGSYGRRELQLHSDIDIVLLHSEMVSKKSLENVQGFIQDCWDIGLEISQQITTVPACAELASRDLSVISSLLDIHLVCGRSSLMTELHYQIQTIHMWPSHDYFYAKLDEQKKRYAKYRETAYNLEPNVKYGPGGLRDLQVLLNIAKRHFNIKKLADGISCGFFTDKEYEALIHCQNFLWNVRFGLHYITQKREERLLFDYQLKLAQLFGYEDNSHSLAIEQFMKHYFTAIKRSRELNEMLLQWFGEVIIDASKEKLTPLDRCFQLSNHYIEVRHPKVFAQNPLALIQLFRWIADNPIIKGVRANTIRLLRQHLYLITPQFRTQPTVTATFMQILRTSNNPYPALQRMSRYGVLAHYLDCFAAVTGQMQYDLFHAFTVDQHTLFVIRNLARFRKEKYKEAFPLCFKLMHVISKRHILYLAALFHDIAKGRGGDHSELGEIEARNFAQIHQLSFEETELLTWLVRHHLLMSQTAQRQDIYAPQTILTFAKRLPQRTYLDYLYLLTVADICATNPSLWNAWKDSLLKELYYATSLSLEQKKQLFDEQSLIKDKQKAALELLTTQNPQLARYRIEAIWHNFKKRYFLHEPPEMIALHTEAILACHKFPLILISPHHARGGTQVFIYMPHREDRFIITTTILTNYATTIHEAMILTCDNQFDMDTYMILDEQNHMLTDEAQIQDLHRSLAHHLADLNRIPQIKKRRLLRHMAHFNFPSQITFSQDEQFTRLFLVTKDRLGLLATLAQAFARFKIYLHNAKIITSGERVEDMFYITNQDGETLNPTEQRDLEVYLIYELDKLL